jgi:hypothetical protein
MENSRPLRLRSYTISSEESVRCTIVDAARATSAAPTFFDPIELKGVGVTLRDGAFRANNPIQELISEIESEFSDWQISCIVSIGTGVQADEKFEKSLTSIAKRCSKIATDTEEVHRQFKERECKPGGRFRDKYFRFNVSQGLQGIGLEEWKEMDSMWSKTYTYMVDIREELGNCVNCLQETVYEGPGYVILRYVLRRLAHSRPDMLNVELSLVWQKLLRKGILSTIVANGHRRYPETAIWRVPHPRTLLLTCRSLARSARMLGLTLYSVLWPLTSSSMSSTHLTMNQSLILTLWALTR